VFFFQAEDGIRDDLVTGVQTCALPIFPTGILLHSGDFKLDNTPIDGRVTDLQGIAEEASRGVHLFLSDSTNAEDPGATGSERSEIGRASCREGACMGGGAGGGVINERK